MKTITIMQGLPGSGKSYHAERLAHETGAIIVSADLFPGLYGRAPDGSVTIQPSLLGKAHGACFRQAYDLLEAGKSVIVDNTNLSQAEVAPYVAMGQAHNCDLVDVLTVSCPIAKAVQRNTHGVPAHVFVRMAATLEQYKPAGHWPFVQGYQARTIENG